MVVSPLLIDVVVDEPAHRLFAYPVNAAAAARITGHNRKTGASGFIATSYLDHAKALWKFWNLQFFGAKMHR